MSDGGEIKGGPKAWRIGSVIGWVLRILGYTCEIVVNDKWGFQDPNRKKPVMMLAWHDRIASSTSVWKRVEVALPMVALTSASKDGAILGGVVGVNGIDVARGSSSRRGAAALMTLCKALRKNKDVYITPDGPRGPRHVLQLGALKLAQLSGAPIVVKLVRPSNYWQLKTWDKLMIPKPCSIIEFCFEDPIYVPKDLTDEELEELRCKIETSMNRFNPENGYGY